MNDYIQMSNESLNNSPKFLSDYAKNFMSASKPQKMGFWSQLKSACKMLSGQTNAEVGRAFRITFQAVTNAVRGIEKKVAEDIRLNRFGHV